MEPLTIKQEVRAFWFLVTTAAYIQHEGFFPNWLTPECPRVTRGISEGTTLLNVIPPRLVRFEQMEPPYVTSTIDEVAIHMDLHRLGFTIGVPTIDNWYDIGLGFLYLGPYDPEFEYDERKGFGIMYYWIRPRQTDVVWTNYYNRKVTHVKES